MTLIEQAIDNPRWLTGPERANEFDWSLLTHIKRFTPALLDDKRWQHHRDAFQTWINVRVAYTACADSSGSSVDRRARGPADPARHPA